MDSESSSSSLSLDAFFDKNQHVMFLDMMYELLPSEYESQEINHLTLAYFAISSLDIVGALDHIDKEEVASWVISFQVHPPDDGGQQNGQFCGFHGSRSSQYPSDVNTAAICNSSHLASTYCALSILKIVGYDLSRIGIHSIATSMKNLQLPDGSFMPIHIGAEADLRFTYCATAISYMLENWSGVDKEKAKQYILSCQSYDGGFGLSPGLESHGGATYCAIASLRLMGFLEDSIKSKDKSSSLIDVPLLLDWLVQRQTSDGGFQGRLNKPSDPCYAFWVSAVLKMLGYYNFVDREALHGSLLNCQSQYGGFSKFAGELPELYHSYYGFTAFSLLEEPGLNPLFVELGITNRAAHGT
ncbi:hypothetical protein V2J09_001294 [Rumex salicifolius]